MSDPKPVIAKKTLSATIGGIASRAPTSSSTSSVKKTTTLAGVKKPLAIKKPIQVVIGPKKTIVKKAVIQKPKQTTESATSSTGRPQRAAAANFLNRLAQHRSALAEYKVAMNVYKQNLAKGLPAKKPKEPNVPKEFEDALRSDETDDEEEESDDEFQEDDEDEEEDEDEDDDEDDNEE